MYQIPFVFGHPLSGLEPNATQREKEVSKEIISIWTDFAKTGLVCPSHNDSRYKILSFSNEMVHLC